jgi:transcription-repair coupling factor (superfamily II helicase)
MSLLLSKFFSTGQPGKLLLDAIQSGAGEVYAVGLKGSAPALVTSLLFDFFKKHILFVTPSTEEAQELFDELLFYRNRTAQSDDMRTSEVLLFPPLETQAYEDVLSHCDVNAQRLWTLYRLCDSDNPCIVVTTARALLQKILPAETLISGCRTVRQGEEIDRDGLCANLVQCGYTRVSVVEDRGDISIRGEVMDIFPPGCPQPVRLDFFGDMIESMKFFDPHTQRSKDELQQVALVPVREVLLTREVLDDLALRAMEPPLAGIFSRSKGRTFFDNIQNGLLPAGVEYCLSFVYPQLATIFDYLPSSVVTFWGERREIEDAMAELAAEAAEHYEAACVERRVVSPPEELFVQAATPGSLSAAGQKVFLQGWDIERRDQHRVNFSARSNEDIRKEMLSFDTQAGALSSLAQKIEKWLGDGVQVVLLCHTKSQCERLGSLLADYELETSVTLDRRFSDVAGEATGDRVEICTGRLSRGFRYEDGLLVLITEEEIFGQKRKRVAVKRYKEGTAISDFSDLKQGDLIVHRDNGIGVYTGFKTLEAGGMRADYLQLEYQGGDKLYLPVDRINLINKYENADDGQPRLDRLGGTTWARTTRKVRESIEKIARDLIELYSARKVFKGHAFNPPDHTYREFEAAFPYEETPDQLAAIGEVMDDMTRPMPMDRLICGDVGYGKTEVALRAAFRCAMEGKQVAVLVPTTVLAQQHYQNFCERFRQYPIRVDILSRFRSARDQKLIIQDLAAGKVDVIIGTHRIVQKDIVFKELGLIVIDEEHRFGVKHKEQLKRLRSSVDVLTLTATPIPRTLQMSLFGIRDFSIIETPPEDRLSIRTTITHFDEMIIRDAIMRELKRGGQTFFVHDRVRSIHAMAGYLRKLLPEARLGVAHGQMHEHELEHVMMQFIRKEVDLLVCTTIIESGLDFPTANTIIINNAHRLGLAQMYQLRGRVGRGKIRAYAYMLVPGSNTMSPLAQKRLEALSEFTELGSGYRLATRDLQIRGAGNILGHSQSGQIESVGMDMYLDLLSQAIAQLRGEKIAPKVEPEVNINLQAYLPEDYVDDVNQRLVLYRRIASVMTDADADDIELELADRFGRLPPQVEMLLDVARTKNVLRENLILSVDFADRQLMFAFHEDAEKSLDKILGIVAADDRRFRFTPDLKLYARCPVPPGRELLQEIRKIFA